MGGIQLSRLRLIKQPLFEVMLVSFISVNEPTCVPLLKLSSAIKQRGTLGLQVLM